ncbi:uncharacterized protein RHOBADRAFT_52392 [Rhodotorula graminis WP1]|uniref:Uncharacterized protein n=1 Tax=Rhodotorula graminis (strain WP1) TaxID=578459 RepID=A0A194SAF0_RHOGW|nr:uncharacterized protein RHOBADRAFT_52392 [Rhodotorula graminis WP1]KPV76376.1 hypothetical protein RHOBADRAFT_52392 [Rhodotorula graminis WP1]
MRLVNPLERSSRSPWVANGLDGIHELTRHDTLVDVRHPRFLCGVVLGQIANPAQQGKRNLEEGTRVVAITFMRGLAEYVADRDERMGFKGDGVLSIGSAKVALDTIKMGQQDRKVILVVTSHNVADELKKLGGAQGVMCVDMPVQRVEQLLEGCRFHSSIVLLSPGQENEKQIPIAHILASRRRSPGRAGQARARIEGRPASGQRWEGDGREPGEV